MWSTERFSAHRNIKDDLYTLQLVNGLMNTSRRLDEKLERIASEKALVTKICKREIEGLLRMGVQITQMTHRCKMSHTRRLSTTPAEMRRSWCEDTGPANIKRLLWMFHQLPGQTHKDITLRAKSHQDLVEDIVKTELNIEFEPDEEPDHKKRNCIQQTYTKVLNSKKQDIMKKRGGNRNQVQALVTRTSPAEETKKRRYYRSKTLFYWQGFNSLGEYRQHKVRTMGKYRNNTL
jgi:hypothetical protein